MRTYPEDEDDRKDAAKLNVADWMIETLRRNPSYVCWGNGEDYMRSGDGWDGAQVLASWSEVWGQNELNELVHGYFFIDRASVTCEACDGIGLNEATKKIDDDWYDFAGTGRRWCYAINDAEVEALIKAGRLSHFTHEQGWFQFDEGANSWRVNKADGAGWVQSDAPAFPTAAKVNAWARKDFGHDAINKWICVRARAESLGVYGKCEKCGGNGRIFTEPSGHLCMQLWFLHPRKGASRGVIVKDIQEADIPAIEAYFVQAINRTIERMSKIANYQNERNA